MGSNDVPPPDVPSYYLTVMNILFQTCGALWTFSYILVLLESRRSKTYSMPLFALANNFGWEIVYSLYIVQSTLEFIGFSIWMIVDVGLVYYTVKYGKEEWKHAPFIAKHLGRIFFGLLFWCMWGHYAFAKWWMDNNIGMKEGKLYKGGAGPDLTELGYWTAGVAQTYLSVASLVQLLVRQHTRGATWGIW